MDRTIIIDDDYGPLWRHYVVRMEETLQKALVAHSRTLALRVDLHFPDPDVLVCAATDSQTITRCMASLRAQLTAQWHRKSQPGGRIHWTDLRYIWVREFDWFGVKPHYHVVLLLNKDAYQSPGNYQFDGTNLATMIMAAWYRALKIDMLTNPKHRSLVKFPKNPCYWLDANSDNVEEVFTDLMFRIRYMAKVRSKHHDDGYRLFACSQG
ncbi:inovirus Gp2 family protein [Yersinia kristensenii]|uniref:YagK/YfjJ C-terminal domain-containing protein n=1 Tax=Yersinia kristensenii TaxID=28152 RepID=A0AB73Q0N4_YERKR|nr:inovirus Gp2 family protein [Yersinia kristensenii]OVZ78999.1 hypothetical protein CBW52_18015 [Yersinia kristensenii]